MGAAADADAAARAVEAAFYSFLRRPGGYALQVRAAWNPAAPRPRRLLESVPERPDEYGQVVLFEAPDYLPGFFAGTGLPLADLADLLAVAARRDKGCLALRRRLGRNRPDLFRDRPAPPEYDALPPERRWPAWKPQARLIERASAETEGRPRLGPMLALLGLLLAALLVHILLWQDPAALTDKMLLEDPGLSDKFAHLLMAFALTGGLCAWTRDPLLVLPLAGLVVFLGLGLEIYQENALDGFVSSRDIVANDLGAACALLTRLSVGVLKG